MKAYGRACFHDGCWVDQNGALSAALMDKHRDTPICNADEGRVKAPSRVQLREACEIQG